MQEFNKITNINLQTFSLEKVKCPVCSQDNYEKYLDIKNYTIVKCLNCGMIYTNPCPTEADLRKFYENTSYHPVERLSRRLKYIFIMKFIEKFTKVHGKFLDIGCSQGDFGRAVMKNKKWEYLGIDLNPHMINYARSLGLNVLKGSIEDFAFLNDEFALVTIWHTLEHLHNPRKTLERVFCVLKRDGLLAIQVPDVSHPRARFQGKNWKYFDPPGHLWYFSKTTLIRLLKSIGYSVIFSRRSFTKMYVTVFSTKS